MYFIGIDGGGTKTSFTLIDDAGVKIGDYVAETSHYEQVGFDGVERVLENGIKRLLMENNLKRKNLGGVFLGLPGYGEAKSVKTKLDEIVNNILKDIPHKVGNDVEVGLGGSLAGMCGINIVSGTGSIALGKDSKGNFIRCGGWGDFIGDEGSAYWIGKKTLEMFAKQSDKRIERGDLYYNIKEVLDLNDDFDIIDYAINKINKDRTKIAEFSSICCDSARKGDKNAIIKEVLDLNDDFDIIDYAINKINKDRTKIAEFSSICCDSARKGDKNAIKIFEEAAYELSLLVKMIINELDFENEVLVSYSGGVFKSEELVLNPLRENLKDYNIKLIKPILTPSEGACLLAYQLVNNNVEESFINNLSREIKLAKA